MNAPMLPPEYDNPAELSAELRALFPPGVIATELLGKAPRSLLTPAELNFIAHCAEKRIHDFTAGRACAHRALRALGIVDFSLLSGQKREPLWPQSIVGSITHTNGYAAAVVARRRDVRSLGIDCEVVDSVDEHLWSRICTASELQRLHALPPPERPRQAALIFAAKEAFYKCQFPLSCAWVGFEDVDIVPVDWPATSGSFRVVPQKPLPVEDSFVAGLFCRFQFRGAWILAAVAATQALPM
jgi:4'-phosphopantetheinyl transferase EntD